MITAISSFNTNKVNFTANPTKAIKKFGGKVARTVENSSLEAPKGLTPKGLTSNSSLPIRFDGGEDISESLGGGTLGTTVGESLATLFSL